MTQDQPTPQPAFPVGPKSPKADIQLLQYYLASWRQLPAAHIDGIYGDETDAAVRQTQSVFKLKVDGIVGPNTWGTLSKGVWVPPTLSKTSSDFVAIKQLQTALAALGFYSAAAWGLWGDATEQAVTNYQTSVLVPADGIVGFQTWASGVGAMSLTLAGLAQQLAPQVPQPSGSVLQ